VSAYFDVPEGSTGKAKKRTIKKLFDGVVARYGPPSSNAAKDQVYHIVFEDGDEQGMSEREFRRARRLYDENHEEEPLPVAPDEWTVHHESVGTKVAAYFKVPDENGHRKRARKVDKLMVGTITKYCAPTRETDSDQLYHVLWEDDDSNDYSENEFEEAKKLYREEFEGQEKDKP
jgi:hypothetical protein